MINAVCGGISLACLTP
nr:hypothetical protein [Shewanella algae]